METCHGLRPMHKIRPYPATIPITAITIARASPITTTVLRVQRKNLDMSLLRVWIQYVRIVPKRVREATTTTITTIAMEIQLQQNGRQL